MTGIFDFPPEITGVVCQYLSVSSLLAMRATCKRWNMEVLANCKTVLVSQNKRGQHSFLHTLTFECEDLENPKIVSLNDDDAKLWFRQVRKFVIIVGAQKLWYPLINDVASLSDGFSLYIGTPVLGSPGCVQLMKKIDSTEKIISASLRVTKWNGKFLTFGPKYYNILLFIDPSQDLPKFRMTSRTTLSLVFQYDHKGKDSDPHQLPSTLFRDFLQGIDCPNIPKFLNLEFEGLVVSRTFIGLATYLDPLIADSLNLVHCQAGQWPKERVQFSTPKLILQYTPLVAATETFVFSNLTFVSLDPWTDSPENEEAFNSLVTANPEISEVEFKSFKFDASVLAHLKGHQNLRILKVYYFIQRRMSIEFDGRLRNVFAELKMTCPKLRTLQIELFNVDMGNLHFKTYTLNNF
jgi:hypothetical protein